MKMKLIEIANATGPALNWLVAVAEGHKPPLLRVLRGNVTLPREDDPMWCDYLDYDIDWSLSGPIADREGIDTVQVFGGPEGSFAVAQGWCAYRHTYGGPINPPRYYGPTRLIAAMRCRVASKFGDEAEVPEELLT